MVDIDTDGFLRARLVAKRLVARDICEFSFGTIGDELDSWDPGAHIDVMTPAGVRRSYSLTGEWPPKEDHYVIAVAREQDGRGGSRSMHDLTRVGDVLRITPAVNAFPVLDAPDHLLIAGGIGITAIRSMFHALRANAASRTTLVYLVRTRAEAAYIDELSSIVDSRVIVHATDENDGRRFDLWSVLREPGQTRIYTCASPALLESVRRLTAHWRASRVHFEDFTPGDGPAAFARPFEATWAPTGLTVHVPSDESLLDVLRSAGVAVPVSCRAGTCGTCQVTLVAGTVEHNDLVLDADQRRTHMTSCVSRGDGHITVGPAHRAS